jgi:hypothetical protein
VGKREGKRPLGRPRRKWEDNMKICPKELEWEGAFWIYLDLDKEKWWAHVNAGEEFFLTVCRSIVWLS